MSNIESHQITHQLINNARIFINCTNIAIKYVRCGVIFSLSVTCAGMRSFDVSDLTSFRSYQDDVSNGGV